MVRTWDFICSPAAHIETLVLNKPCQKEKSSLRIERGSASCRGLFKPFPPRHPIPAQSQAKLRFYGLEKPRRLQPRTALLLRLNRPGRGAEQRSAWAVHPPILPRIRLSVSALCRDRGVSEPRPSGVRIRLGEPRGGCEPASAPRRLWLPPAALRDDETRPGAMPRHPHTKSCSDEADTCGTHKL